MLGKNLDHGIKDAETEERYEAIILCGGEGWRLKPDEWMPKPLLNITPAERLLDRQIHWLIDEGFSKIILASNRSYSESQFFESDKIEICIERESLGTGGAVKRAASLVERERFYVMNVDDIVFYDPKSLFKVANLDAAVLLARPQLPFGKIILQGDDNLVKGFEERPMLGIWANAGHYVFSKEIVAQYFPTRGDLESRACSQIIKSNRLRGLKYPGEWLTLNTMKDLIRIQEYFRELAIKKPKTRKGESTEASYSGGDKSV